LTYRRKIHGILSLLTASHYIFFIKEAAAMTDDNDELEQDSLPEPESEKDPESDEPESSDTQKDVLLQVQEEDLEFQKKLRLATNQLNIATAFSKEDGDLEQILRYSKEASTLFDELLDAKPDDPGILPLKKKAERIVIMCTYSPSQLDNLLVEAKELYAKGMEKMHLEHEFQARWFLENCLSKIRPLLIVWGVTPETRSMVVAVGENLITLDESSALKGRKEDEEKIFSMLDRLNLIKDMPIMEILNNETYRELLNMKKFFKRMEEETEVKGLEEIFRDVDAEMYHIYADDIRTAIEETYRINLMEKKPDFDKVDALSEKVRSLNIEPSRGDFILSYADDVRMKFTIKMKQMDELNELIEGRRRILRSGLDDVPRAKRLDRLFNEMKGGEDSTGYPIKNKEKFEKIKDLLNLIEPEKVPEEEIAEEAETPEAVSAEKVEKPKAASAEEIKTPEAAAAEEVKTPEAASKEEVEKPKVSLKEEEKAPEAKAEEKPAEVDTTAECKEVTDELLIERYCEMPEGNEKDEINTFLDGITADLIFDTTKYTPTKLTFADDIGIVIESLRRQIEALVSSKAYLPFVKAEKEKDAETVKTEDDEVSEKFID